MATNDGLQDIITTRSRSYEKAQANNIMDMDKGLANAEKMATIYKDIFADMQKIYNSGEKSVDLMNKAAQDVKNAVEQAKYGVQNAKTAKNAKNTYYDQAKKDAAEKGDSRTLDKLNAQQRKEAREDNKKFNQEQLKTMKDTFGNIANGLITFNPAELATGFKALKENLKDMKDYYGSKGGALTAIAGEAVEAMSKFTKGLESTIKSIAGYKTA